MAGQKLVASLLWAALVSALVLVDCGVRADEGVLGVQEARSDGSDSAAIAAEIDRLKSEIQRLETRLEESNKILKSKDEAIEKLEKVTQEKSDGISKLKTEILSIQKQGTSDAEEQVQKAHARVAELQKEVDQIKTVLETQSKEKASLKTRARESEKKIQELNLELKNLQKVSDEQRNKIRKLERALQVAEEETLKAKLEASSRTKQLLEVHDAWLPLWLVQHSIRLQAFILTEWNEHGKPAMESLVEKAIETKGQVGEWASPHIETIKTTWAPAIQEKWVLTIEYLEPHIQLARTKVAEAYEASKAAAEPHLIKVQELADPYYQDLKKFCEPYVEQVCTAAKPHIEKAREALKPHTEKAIHAYGKFLESATAFHHQVQDTIREKMESHELTRDLISKELVFFLASALLAFPIFVLSRMCCNVLCQGSKKVSPHTHPHHHGKRKHKRSHADK